MPGKEREGLQGHSEQSKGGANKRQNFKRKLMTYTKTQQV